MQTPLVASRARAIVNEDADMLAGTPIKGLRPWVVILRFTLSRKKLASLGCRLEYASDSEFATHMVEPKKLLIEPTLSLKNTNESRYLLMLMST